MKNRRINRKYFKDNKEKNGKYKELFGIYYYKNDILHREDGPAIIYKSNTKSWYINGKKHRIGAPAIEWSNGDKEWLINDEFHREDGPAIEYATGHKEWWYYDIQAKNEKQFYNEQWRKEVLLDLV